MSVTPAPVSARGVFSNRLIKSGDATANGTLRPSNTIAKPWETAHCAAASSGRRSASTASA
jgi:hypothetical protein